MNTTRMNYALKALIIGILSLQATFASQAETITNLVSVTNLKATGNSINPWPHYSITLGDQTWEGAVTNTAGISTTVRTQAFEVGQVYQGRIELLPEPLPNVPEMAMFNTGVDSGGAGLSGGAAELHWTYVNVYLNPVTTYVVDPGYSPYYLPTTALANNDTSAWIRGGSEGHFDLSFTVPNDMAYSLVLNFRASASGYYPNAVGCSVNGQNATRLNPYSDQGWSLPSDIANNDWGYFTSTNLVPGTNIIRLGMGYGFGGTNYGRVEFLPFTYDDGVAPAPGKLISPAHLNLPLSGCQRLYINGFLATPTMNLAQANWQDTTCNFTFQIRESTNETPLVAWEPYTNSPSKDPLIPSVNTIDQNCSYFTLPADGKPHVQARVIPPYNTNVLSFSISGETLGCIITQDGVLTTGKTNGMITVVVSGISDPCLISTFKFNIKEHVCACETCAVTAKNNSVDVTMGLGSSPIADALFLAVKEEYPSEFLGTPAALQANFSRPDIDTVRDAGGIIQQVKSQDWLITVNTNSDSQFTLDFYPSSQATAKDTNGLYGFTGFPTRSVTLENVGGDTNHFRVTESNKGIIADYYWQGSGWNLVQGGIRQNVRQETINGDQKTVTRQILNASSQLEQETIEVYQTFPLGEQILQSVTGNKTNSYTYDSEGRLLTSQLADGSWEILGYDAQGRQINRFSPFINSAPTTNAADCRLTVSEYGTDPISGSGDDGTVMANAPRRTIDYVQGQEVARRYTIWLEGVRKDIQCITPGATWDDTNNLVTTTWLHVDAAHYGQPYRVFHPDGTVDESTDGLITTNGSTYLLQVQSSGAINTNGDFIAGSKTETYKDPANLRTVARITTDIASQLVTDLEFYYYDSAGHLTNTTYLDGTQSTSQYDCCHLVSTTDRRGITTSFGHDALDRVITTTRDGITTSNVLNAVGNTLATYRIGTNGAITLQSESGYDTEGQLLWQNNARGQTTTFTNYTDASGQAIQVTSFLAVTNAQITARDGSTISSLGNASQQTRYEYGTEVVDGMRQSYVLTIPLDVDGSDTTEWQKAYTDAGNRITKTVYANGEETKAYNDKGQLIKEVDRDGVTTLYSYNELGQVEYRALDANRNGIIDLAGPDRVTQTTSDVTFHGTNVVHRALNYAYLDSSANPTLISSSETAVDAQITWSSSGTGTNQTTTVANGDGTWSTIETEANGIVTTRTYAGDRLLNLEVTDPTGTLKSETYAYDESNRPWQTSDARNGTTTYGYGVADQIETITAPPPAEGQAPSVTTRVYDDYGRMFTTQAPDGTWVTNEFYLNGSLKKVYGSRAYPEETTYDFANRKKTLTTWGAAGAAVTTWNYDSNGRLQSKVYADNHGPSYTYTDAGRIKTRTWARGVVTTNSYNDAGDLVSLTYSDGTTPVSFGYDRMGRPNSISGTTTNWLVYNTSGQLVSENAGSVALNYFSEIARDFDELGRLNTISNGLVGYSATLANSGRRITGISNGIAATYGYVPNSGLLATTTVQTSSALVTSREYDHLNRLLSITAGATGLSASYEYNTANQRTALTNADGSFWAFGYDELGQVTNANRHFANGERISGQQFAFSYDAIGNRSYNSVGGNADGSGMRQAQYGVNALNQYTNREVPGFIEVSGTATGTVAVNGQAPTWQGDYFRSELAVDNSVASVLTNITITASDATSTALVARASFVPRSPEVFTYDLDGNLTQDGQWGYNWDAENRLTRMESLTNAVPAEHRKQLNFTYDWQGRRIAKLVKQWNPETATYQITSFRKFHYDGWNLICEQDEVTGMKISYTWGLDLSQSLQGAGGVGGLLWITVQAGPLAGTYSVHYDGNGNIIGLVSATDGSVVARYEYGPFGEVLRATGPMARTNPFRWSTRYQDDETDIVMYPGRPYRDGRFLTRDPAQELGGPNPYCFVGNNPISRYDALGLWGSDVHYWRTQRWASEMGIGSPYSVVIGSMDNAIDTMYDPTQMNDRNWSWHFDRSGSANPDDDTRLKHRTEELDAAKARCNWSAGNDDPANASVHLGYSLHPLQDWVAHADFNRKLEAPTLAGVGFPENRHYWHNWDAGGWWTGTQYQPDDPTLDSGGVDGRATFLSGVMFLGTVLSNGDRTYYTHFHPGSERIRKTEQLTKDLFSDFKSYVAQHSKPCGQCYKAFLGGN